MKSFWKLFLCLLGVYLLIGVVLMSYITSENYVNIFIAFFHLLTTPKGWLLILIWPFSLFLAMLGGGLG